MDIERQMEINSDRRERANDRYYDTLLAKADAAAELIGEICREGKKVFYINQRRESGSLTGKTREFFSHAEAELFLIRNRYV